MERRSTASPAELSWYPSNHAQPSDVCQSWTRITLNIMGWLNWTLADLVTRSTSPDLGNTVDPSLCRARSLPFVAPLAKLTSARSSCRSQLTSAHRWRARALAGRSLSVHVVRHGGPANTRSAGFTRRPSPR
jgi:hypothetical protein